MQFQLVGPSIIQDTYRIDCFYRSLHYYYSTNYWFIIRYRLEWDYIFNQDIDEFFVPDQQKTIPEFMTWLEERNPTKPDYYVIAEDFFPTWETRAQSM